MGIRIKAATLPFGLDARVSCVHIGDHDQMKLGAATPAAPAAQSLQRDSAIFLRKL